MSLRTSRDLLQYLYDGGRVLADGAVGSELIRSGVDPQSVVEANLSQPESVRDLHRRSIDAGAELVTTNTFGMPTGPRWTAAFEAGVSIVAAAVLDARTDVAVMLSVYPAELLQEPAVVLSPFDRSIAQEWLLLIETAISIQEAVAAVELARRSGVRFVAATCHFQSDGVMPDGSSPEQAAAALQAAGASIVGGNCGTVPEEMVAVATRMRRATELPLLFQPNAGLPQCGEDGWVYPVDPNRFAAAATRLFEAGVSIVGGCCGVTPAHIAAAGNLLFHPQRRE
jgi:5-methyltetrahydrofolate--homocysteine methyltransferase